MLAKLREELRLTSDEDSEEDEREDEPSIANNKNLDAV